MKYISLAAGERQWQRGNSLFGVGDLVLDSTFIISTPTVRTSTLFILGLDVVVTELANLEKDDMSVHTPSQRSMRVMKRT
jgi:hypothetical protein